jgi:hypothetical protein
MAAEIKLIFLHWGYFQSYSSPPFQGELQFNSTCNGPLSLLALMICAQTQGIFYIANGVLERKYRIEECNNTY